MQSLFHWSLVIHDQLFRDMELEGRFRSEETMGRVMDGWNNEYNLFIPPEFQNKAYLTVPGWWIDYDWSPMITINTHTFLAYQSSDAVVGSMKSQESVVYIQES